MTDFAPAQEADRVSRAAVTKVAVASVVVLAGSLAAVVWLMGGIAGASATAPPAASRAPESLLGARSGRAERATLDRLEWIDRDAGTARIPIERAMELVADGVDAGAAP